MTPYLRRLRALPLLLLLLVLPAPTAAAAPVQTGSRLARIADVHLERRPAQRRQPGR